MLPVDDWGPEDCGHKVTKIQGFGVGFFGLFIRAEASQVANNSCTSVEH